MIGLALAAVGIPLAPTLVDLLGASGSAAPHAVSYLRISLLGLPAMLVVLAATGTLRGLKDTRTPLLATAAAAHLPADHDLCRRCSG
jgi:Na+-driven multidrug efflux pump